MIVFATGASPEREDVTADIVNKNFTGEQREKITFFYLRGGFDRSRLKGIDRFLMAFSSTALKRKRKELPTKRGCWAPLSTGGLYRREEIASLVAFARE